MVHKVHFCHLLKLAKEAGEGMEQDAFLNDLAEYSKKNLIQFFGKFRHQIQRLMGSLAFVNELEDTKYSDLTSDVHWEYLTQ